jgi:hypothetical protein
MLYTEILRWLDQENCSLEPVLRIQLGALFSISWVCMLRMDKALKIKMDDIKLDCVEVRNGANYTYHEIYVRDRKTDSGNRQYYCGKNA